MRLLVATLMVMAYCMALLAEGRYTLAEVPAWVPQDKKTAFLDLINGAYADSISAEEYAKILAADRIIQECQVQDRVVVFYTERATLKEKLVVRHGATEKTVKCDFKGSQAEILVTSKNDTDWLFAIEVSTVSIAIGIIIGFFLAK